MPKSKTATKGRLIDVLQGKTLHQAFLLDIPSQDPSLIWVKWSSTDQNDLVPVKDVKEQESKRRRRRTNTHALTEDEATPATVQRNPARDAGKVRHRDATVRTVDPGPSPSKDDTSTAARLVSPEKEAAQPKDVTRLPSTATTAACAPAEILCLGSSVWIGNKKATVIGDSYVGGRKGKHKRQLQIRWHDAEGGAPTLYVTADEILWQSSYADENASVPFKEAHEESEDDEKEVMKNIDRATRELIGTVDPDENASVAFKEAQCSDEDEESEDDEKEVMKNIVRATRELIGTIDHEIMMLRDLVELVSRECQLRNPEVYRKLIEKHIVDLLKDKDLKNSEAIEKEPEGR